MKSKAINLMSIRECIYHIIANISPYDDIEDVSLWYVLKEMATKLINSIGVNSMTFLMKIQIHI